MQEIRIIKKPITRLELKKIAEERFGDLVKAAVDIGSEVSRARIAQNTNPERFERSVARALELFYLTLSDRRLFGRLKEIGRAREVFCDAVFGGKEYKSNLSDLEKYFNHFALSVR